jgi:hypothetical protein
MLGAPLELHLSGYGVRTQAWKIVAKTGDISA